MTIFVIMLPGDDTPVAIEADSFGVLSDGTLTLFRESDVNGCGPVRAYAPGCWASIEELNQ